MLQEGDDWSRTATSCRDWVSLKLSCCKPPAEHRTTKARLQYGFYGDTNSQKNCMTLFHPILLMNALFEIDSSWTIKVQKAIMVTRCGPSSSVLKKLQTPEVNHLFQEINCTAVRGRQQTLRLSNKQHSTLTFNPLSCIYQIIHGTQVDKSIVYTGHFR